MAKPVYWPAGTTGGEANPQARKWRINAVSPLERDAKEFATLAHAAAGNTRKFVGGPYIAHPAEVVSILRRYTDDPATLAAGWLHDVKDDAGITHDELCCRFGVEVAEIVEALSADVTMVKLPRRERVAIAIAKLSVATAKAHNVRAADIISNSRSIAQRDPRFARTYLPEKAGTLLVATLAFPDLLAEAWCVVHNAAQSLSPELKIPA
jgi:(p)ppGpp synthase/HD superfamily hydrolase